MKRRSLVALVSAAVLFMIGVLAVSAVFYVTRTDSGRARLRSLVQPLLSGAARGGSFYIGKLGGNFITNITIDSIAIRDKRGVLMLSTGPVSLTFNPRDLMDYRIYVTRATVEHPYVHLIQHENGVWNYQEIFASANEKSRLPKDEAARNLGDYIVIDSTTAHNASFLLTIPWHPSEKGAARDSVIREHLKDPSKMVARTYDGYARTYLWSNAQAFISHARLADPDSDRKYGQQFNVASLSVDEYEPTFKFRNLKASVRRLADSVWLDVPHFDMPASTGHGSGKLWWGSELPMRYDIAVRGDSVSLNDVNWVYPTLPRTGGGTLDLRIRNDPKDLQIIDFVLDNMDVHSTKSHITGDMTFGSGAPVLLVQNVNVRADPMDFDLIRALNGKPFPEDWQGTFNGTVKARGGPLTHFVVDDARGTYTDAHIRGAVSRFAGNGELDILNPAFTAFHHFNVNIGSLDLRTIEYLFPSFPKLGGIASGTATLDSSWLDVRFSNAQVALQDGPGDPTRVTGSGRITDAGAFMQYDVALDAEPLSWTMIARSPAYSFLPFRGLMSGPIRATGSAPDLQLSTSLEGPAGAFSFDGRVDLDSLGGYGAHGRGEFSALSVSTLLDNASIPAGTLSGHYDVDLTGQDAATLSGSADVATERTVVDSVRVYPSEASVRFADGRIYVDSLLVRSTAATLAASGGIGLPRGQPDSLHFSLSVDSLGGLRPYISHPDTTLLGRAATPLDSLSGAATITGVATGTLDRLDLSGRVTASNLYRNGERVQAVAGAFDVRDLLGARVAAAELHVDSAVVAGVALDTVGASVRLDDSEHGHFAVSALSHNGPTASTSGSWSDVNDAQSVVLDSLRFTIGSDDWQLARATRLTKDSLGLRLDSLVLRNRDTGVVVLSADLPNTGRVTGQLRASRVGLGEFTSLAQFRDSVSGIADLDVELSGTQAAPQLTADAALTAIRVRNVSIDTVSASGRYASERMALNGAVVRAGQTAVTASADLPVEFTLPLGFRRMPGALSGGLRAEGTDLSIVSTLLKGTVDSVSGRLSADLRLGGRWNAPVFDGNLAVRNGSAIVQPIGVKLVAINGSIAGAVTPNGSQDSIAVELRAANDRQPSDTAHLSGWVKLPQQGKESPAIDLGLVANQFHALNKRSLADLYLSTVEPLRLSGTLQAPVLNGSLRVDRGSIYLADRDLARKLAVEEVLDSTTSTGGNGFAVLSTLLTNLQIHDVIISLGDNVRLRSSEANVRLAGQLQLITDPTLSTHVLASGALVPRLSLQGQLRTVDGTYLLDFGVVQREFTVLADGTVTFDGPPETPTLDIKAQYNVKQPRDRDIDVIANLTGRVPNYTLTLASDAGYTISQSDLVSYLLTGRPGLDLGGVNSNGASQVLASVLAPTLSAVAAAGLRQNLGSWFDMLQFQLGAADNTQGQGSLGIGQYLYGATIGVEQQLGRKLYFNVNTGLCALAPSAANFTPLGSVGAKVEYRLNPALSLQVAYDPPTANRICSREAEFLTGFQPTPGQFSFSFTHLWHF